MEAGFSKASSGNLPVVNLDMISDYFSKNKNFDTVEQRGVKAARSARESYGDNAIGYVQVHRLGRICTIKCRMTPEHKVRAQTYTVKALINEEDEEIVEVLCHDCKAGQGGCKHALAFIFWLHRRSEEPSPTEVKCYWKKAKLSSVGDSVKFINSFELTKNMSRTCLGKVLNTEEFFNKAMLQFKKQDTINQVTKNFHRTADFSVISLHFSFIKFKTSGLQQTVEEFLCYLSKNMKSIECDKIQEVTTTQNESSLWHEMRYGRITASKLHEAAHCHTTKGSLVETILGGRKLIDTPALARGRKLEKLVIAVVEINLKTKIQKAGLFLNPDYSVFGASPDGLDEQNVYEVKCPSSKKTVTCYVKDGQPTPKVYAQLLLQMFFCKKNSGYLCIAAPDFEKTKHVEIIKTAWR